MTEQVAENSGIHTGFICPGMSLSCSLPLGACIFRARGLGTKSTTGMNKTTFWYNRGNLTYSALHLVTFSHTTGLSDFINYSLLFSSKSYSALKSLWASIIALLPPSCCSQSPAGLQAVKFPVSFWLHCRSNAALLDVAEEHYQFCRTKLSSISLCSQRTA